MMKKHLNREGVSRALKPFSEFQYVCVSARMRTNASKKEKEVKDSRVYITSVQRKTKPHTPTRRTQRAQKRTPYSCNKVSGGRAPRCAHRFSSCYNKRHKKMGLLTTATVLAQNGARLFF